MDNWSTPRAVALATGLAIIAIPASAHDVHYTGHGTGIQGTVLVGDPANGQIRKDLLIVDVAMSCTGKEKEEVASAISTPAPVLIQAKNVRGWTQGINNLSATEAEIENLKFQAGGHTIEATMLSSFAHASCTENPIGFAHEQGSTFATLKIDGVPYVNLTGQPNQTIPIPGFGQIIVNEQSPQDPWVNSEETTVSALHVKLTQPNLSGDVYFARATAKITCKRTSA